MSHGRAWSRGARGLLVITALIVVLGPLMALVVQTVASLASGRGEWAALALPTGRRLDLLRQSVSLAMAVALAGMLLGVLAGVTLWRLPSRPRQTARWAVWVAAFVPPYVH